MLYTYIYVTKNNRLFEAQYARFYCGPISIINALYYDKYPITDELRKNIRIRCGTRYKFRDGFKGTRPAYMTYVIKRFWPKSFCVTGMTKCRDIVCNDSYTKFIMLYSYRIRHHVRFHYVFMYKDGSKMHKQNSEFSNEVITPIRTCIKSTVGHYPGTDIITPTVWVLN
jgi:hypothetical protein